MMVTELKYGLPSYGVSRLVRDRRLYPTIMQMNLAECQDALSDFKDSTRGPFRGSLGDAAEKVSGYAGEILVEVPTLRMLPDLESRLDCLDECLDAVEGIRKVIVESGSGLFTKKFRKRGAALCHSLRKLIFQAHDEWCWRSS